MPSPNDIKGDTSEAFFIAKFIQLGWHVSKPFNSHLIYDLILDRGKGLERVQVKTGRIERRYIIFNCCDSEQKPYAGRVELIAVYSPDLQKYYLVDPKEFGTKGFLRTAEPNQSSGKKCTYAKDYEI